MARAAAFLSWLRLPPAALLAASLLAVWAPSSHAEATLNALAAAVVPGAEAVGPARGAPPALPVMAGGKAVGWLAFTDEVVGAVGYAGKPLRIAVGVDLKGTITGARLVAHQEPILVIGITDERLQAFLDQFAGIDAASGTATAMTEDAIEAVSGATYSSALMTDGVLGTARAVIRSRGLDGTGAAMGARLDRDSFAPADWAALAAEGAIAARIVTNAEADALLGPDRFAAGADPMAPFLTLYAALATPAAIGRNLLGDATYEATIGRADAATLAVLIAGSGRYSFKGADWRQSGTFERIQLVQGGRTFRFAATDHTRIDLLAAAGAPDVREAGLFSVRATDGFDPLTPWRLDVLIERDGADGATRYATVSLDYALPERLILDRLTPEVAATPLWRTMWQARPIRIAVLVAALATLTTLLFAQDGLARRRRLYRAVRLGFLGFTLVWLGWYAGAQLSVINVLAFAQALMTGFRWETFLIDPLMFLLWSYVAVAMLFWGRGVFCGWLCPFGALQELLHEAARALKVRQVVVPFAVHERLWPIKYVVFLGLFALSLGSLGTALAAAEIEPFKTAITLRFDRAWPFVLFVLALLTVGLFVERTFCRYLCPLGAALAIPARLRMFDWLKRKRQCGVECNICALRCTVQAIHPDGRINPNECIHCLNCQVLYHDDRACPPLIERRKRREARAALRDAAKAKAGATP
jgi:transcriptional regulator of nitric oxide reductase/ferredoxin